jgi:hypothetical protein
MYNYRARKLIRQVQPFCVTALVVVLHDSSFQLLAHVRIYTSLKDETSQWGKAVTALTRLRIA